MTVRLLLPGIAGRSQHALPQWCALERRGVQQVQTDVLDVVLHLLELTQYHGPLLLDLSLVQRKALSHFRQQLHGCVEIVDKKNVCFNLYKRKCKGLV